MKNYPIILLVTMLLLCCSSGAKGQGVLFSEYRIVLDKNAVTSMYVTNPTEHTYTYNISFVNKRMDKNGRITELPSDENPDFSLKRYLRIFPRSIVLEPGKSQEVQIQLKTPDSLPDGEYRSFIHFVPREATVGADTLSQQGVKMAVQFRIASDIPIIYRKNATVDWVRIDSVTLSPMNRDIQMLNMTLRREGTRSVYGKIYVAGFSGGKEVSAAVSEGSCAIYCEIPELYVSLPVSIANLDRNEDGSITLNIAYIDSEKKKAENAVTWAQRKVTLPVLQ